MRHYRWSACFVTSRCSCLSESLARVTYTGPDCGNMCVGSFSSQLTCSRGMFNIYIGHPPSPGQGAMRGFQWLVTADIRLSTSTQGTPGLITDVTPIILITEHMRDESRDTGLKYEYCSGSHYEMPVKLAPFWNGRETLQHDLLSNTHLDVTLHWRSADLICLCSSYSG